MDTFTIARVGVADLDDLLPLMRAYCDFYSVSPPDDDLLGMSRALIEDPEHEGVQLLARLADGRAAGFASVFWTWDTTEGGRIAVMNDLYVDSSARGHGVGTELIEACRAEARERGALRLAWQTALDNTPARSVYDRLGGERSQWLDYSLPVDG
jgi:GNAT superfamily N-acetyltransferase